MLNASIALDNGTFENYDYSFEGMDLSEGFIFFRSIELGDINQASKHFTKEKDDNGLTSNLRKIFEYFQMRQPEQVEPELQDLIDTEDISTIKEYVETSNLSAYNKAMEYLRLARICYQEDKLDFGDQISSLVKPNAFRAIKYQGPLRQEKDKVRSIKEIKIRKREKQF